jgi:hypothetical protein
MRLAFAFGLLVAAGATVWGQTPQPFPRADRPARDTPTPVESARPQTPVDRTGAAQPSAPAGMDAPSAAAVGFPVYPNAQFLVSYEAGKGQRYYLYGSLTGFEELVKYYQTILKDRGARVYDDPGTHLFAQRFREDTMAFPPGVTIKDWTSGGSQGFPHPRLGGTPERFPTVIMIVPPPQPTAAMR